MFTINFFFWALLTVTSFLAFTLYRAVKLVEELESVERNAAYWAKHACNLAKRLFEAEDDLDALRDGARISQDRISLLSSIIEEEREANCDMAGQLEYALERLDSFEL